MNASSVETSGFDFSARWAIDTNAGIFTPSFVGTYISNYDLVDPQAGAVSGDGDRNFNNFGSPTPQMRFNAGLDWSFSAHSANIFVRHIDSYSDDQNGGLKVDSDTRVDIQYSLAINQYLDRDKLTAITIGARNVFDETAPQVFTNGGFDSRVHDPRGRLLYLGLNLEL